MLTKKEIENRILEIVEERYPQFEYVDSFWIGDSTYKVELSREVDGKTKFYAVYYDTDSDEFELEFITEY